MSGEKETNGHGPITTTDVVVLLRVKGSTSKSQFTAGLVVRNGVVVSTAPLLRFMRGWHVKNAIQRIVANGWTMEVVEERNLLCNNQGKIE
jgi:hypothetical protein